LAFGEDQPDALVSGQLFDGERQALDHAPDRIGLTADVLGELL
jgi:hypothetical protein